MKKLILISFLLILPISAWAALININTADFVELDKIPQVGPVTAGLIIEYRNANGPFKTIEEVKNVKGIGDATFLKMKDFITVGSVDTSTGQPPSSDLTIPDSSDDSNNDDSSVHTGETDISDYTKESFKISAGRERLATVRTPILFSVSQNKKGKTTNYFTWNFGDGTSAVGTKVYHTYQFSGRYNVVLNGSIDNDEEAVARTTVIVTEANIKIIAIDLSAGYVEIMNNSDQEQNLNNWALRAGGQEYTFPLDTIISSRTSIKVPLKTLGLIDQMTQNIKEIILVYPDGGVASGASLLDIENSTRIAELKKQLAEIRQQIAENISTVPETKFQAQTPRNLVSGTATLPNVVVLAKEPSWWAKIKNAIFK